MSWGACVWWRLRWALRLPGLISPVIRTLRGQVRIPAASRTDAAVAAVEAFLDQPASDMPWTGASSLSSWIFRTCDVSFFLHVVWPAYPAATAQVPPSIHTCTADFRNRRMKSVIKLANSHMTQSAWVFVMDCVRAIMALTWGSWGYGPAERWHLLPRPNYLIRIMPA